MELKKGVSEIPTWQLEQAKKVQTAILPNKIPNWNCLSFAYEYHSLDAIGGDYLDFFNIKGNKKGLLIADVSGHGIPAAIITAMAKMSFSNHAEYYDSPKEILSRVNQDIYGLLKDSGLYITCFFLVIDQNLHIRYTSAGHQPMIYYNNKQNSFEILKTEGLFLGMFEDVWETYQEKELQLSAGDRIVLFTDGLIESRNPESEQYGLERLEETVMFASALPVDKLAKMLISDITSFAGGETNFKDDISVLGIDISLKFNDFQNHYNMGLKYMTQNNPNWAKEFMEAFALNQDHFDVALQLGKYYLKLKNFAEARKCFEKLIANKNSNPQVFFYLAQIYMEEKKFIKAIPIFKEILKKQPLLKEAKSNIGYCYYSIGNLRKAKEIYQELHKSNPLTPYYQQVLKTIENAIHSKELPHA